jgi:hypothetical protein
MGLADNKAREATAARAAAELASQRASANRQREEQTKASNALTAAAAAEALRKLQSGQAMTIRERELLGMPGIPASPTTSKQATPTSTKSTTTISPTTGSSVPAVDTTTPPPTPTTPKVEISNNQAPAIKSAPIDTVEFIDETFSDELIIDLLFEDVGGQELLTIARNDTVNGQAVVYQPFKNLGILQELYNPTTLLRLQETSDKFFSNFTINLRDRIPNVGSGENGKNYKLDLASGEGIIEFINIRPDEQVEVQIISAGIIEDIDITEGTES